MTAAPAGAPGLLGFPLPLVCPRCRTGLTAQEHEVRCEQGHRFPLREGYLDLVVGDRFDDPTDDECLCYEERANVDTTRSYWSPTLRGLLADCGHRPIVLSLGCGTGADVDVLCEDGLEAVGIDNGNRTRSWPRRVEPRRFLLANGMHLPFPDESFDAVFCGCVFPHVGVEGDSDRVAADGLEHRAALAREMTRVLRPGGRVVVASPNRHCPVDIFHGRRPGQFRPRWNPPGRRFLLSVADYDRLFREAGCRAAEPLPVEGYWGFIRSRDSWRGRLLALPVRFSFWLTSRVRALRGSPLAPWIVVLARKETA